MSDLNVSDAYNIIKPLSILVLELLIYAIFVFNFYRFLAKRDILKLSLERYQKGGNRFLRVIIFIIQHILLFPIITFCWFGVLVVLLALMGKNQTVTSVLLVSAGLVGTIRCTAYYSEDLSRDLAKMLPFAILGIYLVDRSYFELSVSSGIIKEIPDYWDQIVYYFMFIIALEFVLKIGYAFISFLWPKRRDYSHGNETSNK